METQIEHFSVRFKHQVFITIKDTPTRKTRHKFILKPKFRETSTANNISGGCEIVSEFFTEHASDTAMFCAKLRDDSVHKRDVMGKWDFATFEFQMSVWMDILYWNGSQAKEASVACLKL